ncbi:MAG TPA: HEAT repeat domain-containing protein [Planctomycetota bacterium]|nr:HEAT repeat domain-containing protein [Planctomycetota bacterium]
MPVATSSRRSWLMPALASAGVVALLVVAVAVLWTFLPRWAPVWVVRHSPWYGPMVRAQAEDGTGGVFHDRVTAAAPARIMPSLAAALADEDRRMRLVAVAACQVIRDGAAVDLLLRALRDTDDEVRWRAASALSFRLQHWSGWQRFHPDHEQPIIDAFIAVLEDPVHYVREDAADGLRARRAVAAAGALDRVLLDHGSPPNPSAVYALHEISGAAALDTLLVVTRHPLPAMRSAAAFCLGEIGDRRALTGVSPLLDDADEAVRARAADALARLEAVAP